MTRASEAVLSGRRRRCRIRALLSARDHRVGHRVGTAGAHVPVQVPPATRSRVSTISSPHPNRRFANTAGMRYSTGRMRLVRMSSANRGGPERRRSAASNCLASSWLCLVDVEANNRTVDARTLGSSLSMASCRRVSLASGAFQTRPECVQRILGEIPWTGGALRFELTREVATYSRVPCALRRQRSAQISIPSGCDPSRIPVFPNDYLMIRPARRQSNDSASVSPQVVARRNDCCESRYVFAIVRGQTLRSDHLGVGNVKVSPLLLVEFHSRGPLAAIRQQRAPGRYYPCQRQQRRRLKYHGSIVTVFEESRPSSG